MGINLLCMSPFPSLYFCIKFLIIIMYFSPNQKKRISVPPFSLNLPENKEDEEQKRKRHI